MDGYLTENQIEYVLYHLQLYVKVVQSHKGKFKFLREGEEPGETQGIVYFRLSDKNYSGESVRYISGIPVLFPVESQDRFYTLHNGNLIYHHDLWKSIFYFLSGRQEYDSTKKDKYGRFRFVDSVQKTFDFARKPVVNYYFEQLHQGISEFDDKSKTAPLKPFEVPYYLLLTHDIDKVAKYNLSYMMANVKRILGLLPRRRQLGGQILLLMKSVLGLFNLTGDRNPYWNFDYIFSTAENFNLRSTFFFLPKNEKGVDADYELDSKKMKQLFDQIAVKRGEVGVHGTVMSSYSLEESARNKALLEKLTGYGMKGIRQHRLSWTFPHTPQIHQSAGYKYDATLGFAEHEGFRNSFCYPFKLYDFEADKMIDVWQIPLNVMDVTLSLYRNYNWTQSMEAIGEIVREVKKFGGVICLLFHNTFLDENEYPGVKAFFEDVMNEISSAGGKGVTCSKLIAEVEKMEPIEYRSSKTAQNDGRDQ